jgi:anti-sigma B factor antagonist
MQLIVERVDDVTVVTVPLDELEISSVEEFKLQMIPIMEESRNVVLDMTSVTFVDSSGCGAIIFCLKRLTEAGGDLKLCGVGKPVGTVFRMIRLHRICDILETREAAVEAFGGRGA